MRTACTALIFGAIASTGLSGCTETLPGDLSPAAALGDADEASGGDRPDYGLRLVESEAGETTVYVFMREGAGEREVLIDRCAEVAVDKANPEGLLLPVDCDGKRIVVEDEDGRLVVYKGEDALVIGPMPEPSDSAAEATA